MLDGGNDKRCGRLFAGIGGPVMVTIRHDMGKAPRPTTPKASRAISNGPTNAVGSDQFAQDPGQGSRHRLIVGFGKCLGLGSGSGQAAVVFKDCRPFGYVASVYEHTGSPTPARR